MLTTVLGSLSQKVDAIKASTDEIGLRRSELLSTIGELAEAGAEADKRIEYLRGKVHHHHEQIGLLWNEVRRLKEASPAPEPSAPAEEFDPSNPANVERFAMRRALWEAEVMECALRAIKMTLEWGRSKHGDKDGKELTVDQRIQHAQVHLLWTPTSSAIYANAPIGRLCDPESGFPDLYHALTQLAIAEWQLQEKKDG